MLCHDSEARDIVAVLWVHEKPYRRCHNGFLGGKTQLDAKATAVVRFHSSNHLGGTALRLPLRRRLALVINKRYGVYLTNHDAGAALTCPECSAFTDWTR
jgi:hypothetical protein